MKVTLAASTAALAAAPFIWRSTFKRRHTGRKPQVAFKRVLTNNSDVPFTHLAPTGRNAHSATVSAARTQQQVQAVVDLQQQQKCAEGEQGVAEEDGGSGDGAEAAKGVRPTSNPAHPYAHTIQGLLAAYNPSSPTPASPSTSTPDATLTSATTSADSAPPMQQPAASSTQSQQQSLQKEESAASSRQQQQQQQQQQKGQQVLHLLLLRPPVFPAAAEDTQFVMVTTPAQLESMTRHLWQVDAFALDIEHHARRCYLGITCLLQISTGDVDYVIDALALHDHLGDALRPIFASPQILKVLHGCSQDVLWLQRDFHLYLVHVFDTEQAAMALGRKARSLASLTLAYCHTELDKSYQSADWRKRPLPEDFVTYARADVRYLLYLCGVLSMELRGLRPPAQPHTQQQQQQQQQQPLYQPSPQHPIPAKLATALYRSQLLTLQLYTKPRHDAVVSAAATALLRHAMVQHQQTQQAQEQAATQPQQDSGGTVTGQAAIHESEEEQQQQEARRGSSLHASTSSVNTSTAKIDSGSETPQGSTHGTLWGVPDYYRLHQRLLALCDWRDSQARKDDESPQYVLPDTMLLALALAAPTTAAGVKEVLHSHAPEPPSRGGDMLSSGSQKGCIFTA